MRALILAAVSLLLLLGCAPSRSAFPHQDSARVSLSQANFRVIKPNARGSDVGFNLFGFIPIVSPSAADATDQVMDQVQSHDRAIALTNVAEERGTTYLVLFSLPRIEVRADIIEFIEH